MRFATKVKDGVQRFGQKHGKTIKIAAKVGAIGLSIAGSAIGLKYQSDEMIQRIPGMKDYSVPPGVHAYRNIF